MTVAQRATRLRSRQARLDAARAHERALTTERNAAVCELARGMSFAAVGRIIGLSGEQVRRIVLDAGRRKEASS